MEGWPSSNVKLVDGLCLLPARLRPNPHELDLGEKQLIIKTQEQCDHYGSVWAGVLCLWGEDVC